LLSLAKTGGGNHAGSVIGAVLPFGWPSGTSTWAGKGLSTDEILALTRGED
jgi:hypothetical protein